MKVAVYPADDGGCGHYRMIWPALALAAQGHDVALNPPGLDGEWRDEIDPLTGAVVAKTFQRVTSGPDADVIVLQRPLRRSLAESIPALQQMGYRVVVEIDDDFAALHARNSSFTSCHPKRSPDRNWQHLARACAQADLVTCSTPALARRYGSHGRAVVLPNYVPERYLAIEPDRTSHLSVGWTGSIGTHPDDLQVTAGAVGRTLGGVEFTVVGTGVGVRDALGLAREPDACGWVSLEEYPERMAAHDIGVVPLADTAFNRAKSRLKMAEYAALGVPVVASPTPDNVALHALGVGRLAARPRDWARELRRLIDDETARIDLAARGRQVMAGLTIEANAWRWAEAWASIRERAAA